MFLLRAQGPERLRIASWPRPYVANPYTWRLAVALGRHGVSTVSRRTLAELIARPQGARWLHLHWPEWMLQDASRPRAVARAAWLFALLDGARARGLRLAWTAHNELGHGEPHPDLGERWRRALVRRCEVVFGHFPSAEEPVRQWGFRGRFVCVPHPHFLDDYPAPPERSVARRALGYDADSVVLLSFGALESYKRPLELCRAFMAQAPAHARLHFAGRASDPALLRALQTLAARDSRVRAESSFLSPSDTVLRFAASSAAVLMYEKMFTSGVAVLALGLGVPVLGSPVNHLATLLGHKFFVPVNKLQELGSAIDTLCSMSATASDEARAWARALDWDSAASVVAKTLTETEH